MIPGWLAGWETPKGQVLEQVGVGRMENYENPGRGAGPGPSGQVYGGLLRRMRNCEARLRGCLSTRPVRPPTMTLRG